MNWKPKICRKSFPIGNNLNALGEFVELVRVGDPENIRPVWCFYYPFVPGRKIGIELEELEGKSWYEGRICQI